MSKKITTLRDIAKMIATRFVEVEDKVSDELYENSDSYYDLSEKNREILYAHPKLYDSITGEGDTVPLSAEEHEALIEFIANGIMIDKEKTLRMYLRGFVECMEYLRCIGAIKQSYMDMDFIDICGKYPSEFKSIVI